MRGRKSKLEAHSEAIEKQVYEGVQHSAIAYEFGVSLAAMCRFIERKGFERKGVSHPAVAGMRETLFYKLNNSQHGAQENYLIKCPGREHKVIVGISEFIELWERAESYKLDGDEKG
jgi:saccharopine dehydrogenase-like NADP-dependent oxidoreductase